ncbi:MAG: hypothetical protein QNJ42_09770 [Crocosphaera sp.]|nr:hypothetical protein [Crocosphaera sp.]
MLINGLQQSQTREDLRNVLNNPDFSSKTVNGEVKFLPNGDRQGQSVLLQVQPSRDHPSGYDFEIIDPKKN